MLICTFVWGLSELQCRKGKDLYLWMSKCPNGPSVKFLVNAGNVATLSRKIGLSHPLLKNLGNIVINANCLMIFSAHNGGIEAYWKSSKRVTTYSDFFIQF